jgi:hypothetical protein
MGTMKSVENITLILTKTIGVYLTALGHSKDQLQQFIDSLRPDLEAQLANVLDPMAQENLQHLQAQIVGKALEIGWNLVDDEMVAIQQIIITAVKVAITTALA